MQEQNLSVPVYENKIAGICGAFLFALPGGIVWFLLYQVGFLASISGLIAIVCSMKGYVLFSKKETTFGVIMSALMSVLVMVLAWYFCLTSDIHEAYAIWFAEGEVDYAPTFVETLSMAYLFLLEPELCLAYLKDLGMGLLFCVIGGYSNVRSALHAQKLAKAGEPVPEHEPMIKVIRADASDEPVADAAGGEAIAADESAADAPPAAAEQAAEVPDENS